ncbi:LytTR family DNA-binding domain-containing protein [Streptococcus macacae]|uniref:LytTr DNA-binding domain protein n=1 Tax=Streptococcus macacae NCTC 11558 TaxID=764298 RepID=G5JWT8_9STRE|nr:LytTR family DNA-binding domain-containing protein [Streptococcus macacae]EHJ52915.1 LytTr DNA-binding domain protein [Streptococcus macacae NCTC 11558]SUN79047.1 transcriptional regulator [Streptococcus macacae NCTC 11558]
MVKSQFEQDSQIPADFPFVLVKAAEKTAAVQQLLDYIDNYQMLSSNAIPIKTMDKIVMLKLDDIVLADVNQTTLKIFTLNGVFTTTETLIHFSNRLNRANFIQISKHALINLDHLESLSDSFSGNMMAKLSNNIKSSVSRKYVKELMVHLGI